MSEHSSTPRRGKRKAVWGLGNGHYRREGQERGDTYPHRKKHQHAADGPATTRKKSNSPCKGGYSTAIPISTIHQDHHHRQRLRVLLSQAHLDGIGPKGRKDNNLVYFADSYASWQKGAIENANKLIRQYIPKGTDFNMITYKFIKHVQYKINDRPRKKINFKSPKNAFFKEILNFALAN